MKHVTTAATRKAISVMTGLVMLSGLSVGYAVPVGAVGDRVRVQLLTRKVNEYEGQHRLTAGAEQYDDAASLTRKVNEYEGQHR